jgi:membrane protein YqaA with SNARE-associated domain
MLKRLYEWTLSLASRKGAEWWLGIISFVESSVFLVPAEALLGPMGLARPERAYRYALIATVGSVLGGLAGWLLGYYAYELIARPVLEFYGSLDKFEMLRSSSSRDAILLMLVTSGAAHLPPMKVVTILSGAAAVNIWLFAAAAIVARGGKFFVIAWLLRRYGEPIRHFIEKRLGIIALAVVLAMVLIYFAMKMVFGSGS